jgi:hypothetical protein
MVTAAAPVPRRPNSTISHTTPGQPTPVQPTRDLQVVVLAVLLALAASPASSADTPRDTVDLDLGYRQMYNLQFDDAHHTFHEFERLHPSDSLGPASDAAAYLFSEFDRLNILHSEFFADNTSFLNLHKPSADPAAKLAFENALARARALTGPAPAKSSPPSQGASNESLFAQVLCFGLHSDYLALIEKRNLAALGEMKDGRVLAERLLALDPSYYDAYLAVGVENYMLSLKPAPVRWFLRAAGAETDKQQGLDRLRQTAEKGRYLAPFARLLLAVAALRDNDLARARQELTWLSATFPRNRLYSDELAKLR